MMVVEGQGEGLQSAWRRSHTRNKGAGICHSPSPMSVCGRGVSEGRRTRSSDALFVSSLLPGKRDLGRDREMGFITCQSRGRFWGFLVNICHFFSSLISYFLHPSFLWSRPIFQKMNIQIYASCSFLLKSSYSYPPNSICQRCKIERSWFLESSKHVINLRYTHWRSPQILPLLIFWYMFFQIFPLFL